MDGAHRLSPAQRQPHPREVRHEGHSHRWHGSHRLEGVAKLNQHGHEAIAAAPNTGVNTLTGEGLAEVLTGAQAVVDVANSPSFEDEPAWDFFTLEDWFIDNAPAPVR